MRRQKRRGYGAPDYPTLSRRRFLISSGVVVIGGLVLGRPSRGSVAPEKPSSTELPDGTFKVELPASLRELQLDGGPIYYRTVVVVGTADVVAFIEDGYPTLLDQLDDALRRFSYDDFQGEDRRDDVAVACLKVLTDAYYGAAAADPSDFLSFEVVVEFSPYDTLAGCSCASVPW